jgi:hypothetical protein
MPPHLSASANVRIFPKFSSPMCLASSSVATASSWLLDHVPRYPPAVGPYSRRTVARSIVGSTIDSTRVRLQTDFFGANLLHRVGLLPMRWKRHEPKQKQFLNSCQCRRRYSCCTQPVTIFVAKTRDPTTAHRVWRRMLRSKLCSSKGLVLHNCVALFRTLHSTRVGLRAFRRLLTISTCATPVSPEMDEVDTQANAAALATLSLVRQLARPAAHGRNAPPLPSGSHHPSIHLHLDWLGNAPLPCEVRG